MTQIGYGAEMIKIDLVAAARPNFMKIAPLYHALSGEDWCQARIVHTGQHYDPNMSDAFFSDLELPDPHVHLGVGSGSHAEQLGGVMIAYERAVSADRPDWIVVVGDVNSTAACAMVGTKLWIPVVHLEAGLRSRDRHMPEEINRLVTDAICDVLWTPSPDADENLRAEGVPAARIDCVGNIMIDSYELMRHKIEAAGTRARMGLEGSRYGVVTLHRPSNVDDVTILAELVDALVRVSASLPLVFSVHPRTRKRLDEFGLGARLAAGAVRLVDPMPYVQFMNLVSGAAAVITDSGGVQEETTYLGIPCLTLRENTERPITVTEGSNRLVKRQQLVELAADAAARRWPTGRKPELWDGRTASRCVAALRRRAGL
jgi:UDP-N-acetylglucosamine 2-epimerase (non-hydrolysing)